MPGKSRRDRGKHSTRSKRRQGAPTKVAPQRVVTDRPATPAVPAASPGVPLLVVTPTSARYPYVVAELRRIGILAGIILAILGVLALVLS